MQVWQTTLKRAVALEGVGVHNGLSASLLLHPASAGRGIVFLRTDLEGRDVLIPTTSRHLASTELATVIGAEGASVFTIEHLMAALYAMRIDNVIVEIKGAEVPVFDGSAKVFVDAIEEVGIATLGTARRMVEVLKPVRVGNDAQWAELLPYRGFQCDIDIAFEHEAIGHQRLILDITPGTFAEEISQARTFGFMKDVERLRGLGLGKGASLQNTIVLDENRVVNDEGLRFKDEFVRHKMLDAIGDLALLGLPLMGAYRSFKGGHKLNAQMVAALLADETAYRIVEFVPETASSSARAGMPLKVAAAAYNPAR